MATHAAADSAISALSKDTESALKRVDARATEGQDLVAEYMAKMQVKIDEASKIKDPKVRDEKLSFLNVEFGTVRKELTQENQDLAQAVAGLMALEEQLGMKIDGLEDLTPAQKALIAEKQAAVDAAKAALKEAESAFTWGGLKNPKADAEAALAKAEEELKTVTLQAKADARSRLMNAEIADSLVTLRLRAQRTIAALEKRRDQLQQQQVIVKRQKDMVYAVVQAKAKEVEELDKAVQAFEQQIAQAEQERLTIMHGSPQAAEADQKLDEMKAKLREIGNDRNAAVSVHQEQQKAALEFQAHETTIIKMIGNIKIWIPTLRIKTENDVVARQAYLEELRGMADEEFAKAIADIGNEASLTMAKKVAQMGAASDKNRQDYMAKQPKRMQEMAAVVSAQNEAAFAALAEDERILDEFRKNYGIDLRGVYGVKPEGAPASA